MKHLDVNPVISIIVCTFNRSHLLRYCLRSLVVQTSAAQLFEVLVVDNGSTDSTERIARLYAGRSGNVRVLAEPQIGLGHARNRGWREARGEWVVYLDDDAMVEPGYVERALWFINHHPFDGFGGPVLPWFKYGRPCWYPNAFVANDKGRDAVGPLPTDQFVDGGNCAFRRKTLAELSGFPTDIGMKGRRLSYGEEVLLQQRLRAAGGTIGFDPELKVRHVILPHKLKVGWLLRASFAHGRDSWVIFDAVPTLRRVGGAFVKALVPLVGLPAALARLRQKDYHIQNLCIDLGTPMFHEWGRVVGALSLQRRTS
ncbi:glycosyltransferase family 2 protein [Trichloromonas sp.]|uniref:glycosyltransferase family 2 protein n=1 Tax=Trichloromonas sp. TaxID=3069249 RepID=UPI003D81A679